MLAKIQRNWITHILLVGKKNGIANPEKILAVPFKTKNGLTITSICILGHLSQGNKDLLSHSNCQKLETTQIFNK